jgi:hypothetical protein
VGAVADVEDTEVRCSVGYRTDCAALVEEVADCLGAAADVVGIAVREVVVGENQIWHLREGQLLRRRDHCMSEVRRCYLDRIERLEYRLRGSVLTREIVVEVDPVPDLSSAMSIRALHLIFDSLRGGGSRLPCGSSKCPPAYPLP